MKYFELLSDYIDKSDLSLREVAEKMEKEKGIKIDKSYISKIKNGTLQKPPAVEILMALAEVTSGDPYKLGWLSMVDNSHTSVLKDLLAISSELMKKGVELDRKYPIPDELNELEVDELVENNHEYRQFYEELNSELEKIRPTGDGVNETIEKQGKLLTEKKQKLWDDFIISNAKNMGEIFSKNHAITPKIPLVRNICADDELFLEENIEDFVYFPTGIKKSPDFAIKVKGDEMIEKGAKDGDIVFFRKVNWAEHNNQIVAAIVKGHACVLRKISWSNRSPEISLTSIDQIKTESKVLPNELNICGVYAGHFTLEK